MVSVVVEKRTTAATPALVQDVHRRTGGRLMRLVTSDEYPVDADARRATCGRGVTPPRPGRPGRPRPPDTERPPAVTEATVHQQRSNNRVVRVSLRGVFGTRAAVAVAVLASAVSRAVNTGFSERPPGTDRGRCRRQVRTSYAVATDGDLHRAATRFSYFRDHGCWPVPPLRERTVDRRWRPRTPAMAAG